MTGPNTEASGSAGSGPTVTVAVQMSGAATACIDAAATYLASQPEAVHRALTQHRADANGRCTGCGNSPGRWPCATAASARRALELITDTASPGVASRDRTPTP